MTINDQDHIVIDCSDIKFCCGPCSSKEEEPKPDKNGKYVFKPYNGGRYNIEYPIDIEENFSLTLKNVRICGSCNSRYLEFINEEDMIESLVQDAKTILKKLEK